MDERDSSPQTTLVILLGASQWPEFPDFHGSQAFANVASDFSRYLLDQEQFGLPKENFLNLFDTDLSPDEIDQAMNRFLDRRTSEMKQVGQDPRDLLFYFVGHGGFVGRNSEYYLAVRCTSSANPAISGIRVEPLATTITSRARYLRRLIILDCCYAAAAFSAFQAEGPAQVAIRQTVEVFKEKAKRVGKGTSLLCSSGKKVPSLLTAEDDYTMFSKALLHVLATRGNPYRPDEAYLSLREVADLTEEVLDRLLEEKAPRPELHSPDQVDGDVADVPFFPNPVVKTVQASQSKQVLPIQGENDKERETPKDKKGDEEHAPSLPALRRMPSGIVFWVSMLMLFGLVMGGLLGVVVTLRGVFMPPPEHVGPSLQITPSSIALGALISLHGSNFTPKGRIGLSYDANIHIIDTDGNSVILADKGGSFTDTAIVEPEWLVGPHTIHAEDATLHKIASFTVIVTGQSPSLRPAHLRLSTDSIDLGSGDQATNSVQTLTLVNLGGGLVTWQTAATQPWLMTSPKSGTFANNQSVQVVIAANRSNLTPGPYTGSVIFTSNAGQIDLPVKMQATPLQPGHQPILQLTPAVLSFSATDGGTNPSGQVATISNPGTQPLQWSATSVISDGPDWLSISPKSGSIAPGASQAITIGATINALLPGVYNSLVTFTSQGSEAVKGSPQSVYVSLTVLPQCLLQVSPGALSFAGVDSQPAPPAKSIDLSVPQGCSAPLNWSATTTTDNGGQWLTIDGQESANGTTPATPSVSVNITTLAPGTYTGVVVFSSTVGTQTLPVTLTISTLSVDPSSLVFNVTGGVATQTFTILNTGSASLKWQATLASDAPPSVSLSASPNTILAGGASVDVRVIVDATGLAGGTTYTTTVVVRAIDPLTGGEISGSPAMIPITIHITSPPPPVSSTIQVSSTHLFFHATSGTASTPQSVVVTNPGAGPVTWTASVPTDAPWLQVSPASNSDAPGASSTLTFTADATGLQPGVYSTAVTIMPAGGTPIQVTVRLRVVAATPATGWVSTADGTMTHVGVVLTGLSATIYTCTVRVAATDGVNNQPVGTPQTIMVTLVVQPI